MRASHARLLKAKSLPYMRLPQAGRQASAGWLLNYLRAHPAFCLFAMFAAVNFGRALLTGKLEQGGGRQGLHAQADVSYTRRHPLSKPYNPGGRNESWAAPGSSAAAGKAKPGVVLSRARKETDVHTHLPFTTMPPAMTENPLTFLARQRMKTKTPAPRGTYVDTLVFVADEASIPTHFDDPQFNLIVYGVPNGAAARPATVRSLLARARPQAIVTIGADKAAFVFLESALTALERQTWFHVVGPHDLTVTAAESFFWQAIQASNGAGPATEPLVSVFSTAFKTGAKIDVPYASLLAQTHTNWEWIIYDDSPADHVETWRRLQALAAADERVKVLRGDRNDGLIGSSKAKACSQARGVLLVELDHDDELTPDCLALLAAAHRRHPEAGFIHSEAVEPYEGSTETVEYGIHVAFGSGAPYKLLVRGSWMVAHTAPVPNHRSLRHIIGVPNHVRAWSRKAYLAVGGHTRGLSVADDYDLILRTMFRYPAVAVRHMAYIQYRQKKGGTFTFLRNSLIQRMVAVIRREHELRIAELLARSHHPDGGPRAITTYDSKPLSLQASPLPPPIYTEYHHSTATAPPGRPWVTVVVSTYNNTAGLNRALESVYAQDYKDWELIIVGDACPGLDAYMETAKNGLIAQWGHFIRWYNLPDHNGDGHHATRNYALNALVASEWVAHLDADAVWRSDHLSSLVSLVAQDPHNLQYALAGFEIGGQPTFVDCPQKFKVDTSSFLFRRSLIRNYGAWKPRSEVGFANDWELVSRWASETWAASGRATVVLEPAA
jgi:O-antigen biosynthesis protein